jgi:hypothetical protein
MKGYKYVKPVEGLLVRDPLQLTPLPTKGMWVAWVGRAGKYWRRRLNDKSIVICDPPKIEIKKEIKNKKEGK